MSRPNASKGFVPDALTAARFEYDDAVPAGAVLLVMDGTALPVALGVIFVVVSLMGMYGPSEKSTTSRRQS